MSLRDISRRETTYVPTGHLPKGDNTQHEKEPSVSGLLVVGRKSSVRERGAFTIVELLVAVSLFITFLAVAVGSFSHILRMQRLLSRRIELVSSLGIVVEQLQREIRTGYDFPMSANLLTGDSLVFQSLAKYPPEAVTFAKLTSVTPNVGDAIVRNGVPITPASMKVKTLAFTVSEVRGVTSLVCSPWKITISIIAVPTGSDTPEDTVRAQTTVTSRVLPEDMRNDPYHCKA